MASEHEGRYYDSPGGASRGGLTKRGTDAFNHGFAHAAAGLPMSLAFNTWRTSGNNFTGAHRSAMIRAYRRVESLPEPRRIAMLTASHRAMPSPLFTDRRQQAPAPLFVSRQQSEAS